MKKLLRKAEVKYYAGGSELLDEIEPLWVKLYELHRQVSTHFSEHFPEIDFSKRKKHLLTNASGDFLRIEIARRSESSEIIGYCISSIRDSISGKMGEIESLYLEPEFRQLGIGGQFMSNALEWMNTLNVQRKILGVGVGNESTFGFYARYNFFPRTVILEQRRNNNV